jgi:hypothetical protein
MRDGRRLAAELARRSCRACQLDLQRKLGPSIISDGADVSPQTESASSRVLSRISSIGYGMRAPWLLVRNARGNVPPARGVTTGQSRRFAGLGANRFVLKSFDTADIEAVVTDFRSRQARDREGL